MVNYNDKANLCLVKAAEIAERHAESQLNLTLRLFMALTYALLDISSAIRESRGYREGGHG